MSDYLVQTWPAPSSMAAAPNWDNGAKPLTPEWWLRRLLQKLRDRRQQLQTYDDYYEGRHNLAFASEKFLKAFGGLFETFADNWTQLVVDAVEERLNVEGFRYGDSAEGDADAWKIWQANRLDAESQIGHTEALISGEASVLVWADDDNDDCGVSITVEDASQMVVEMAAGSRRARLAALKQWVADDGTALATLYLPNAIFKYRSTQLTVPSSMSVVIESSTWVPREVPGEQWPLRNPLGVVPVVPLLNRPRLKLPKGSNLLGRSEIHNVIPLQNGVNKLVADMFVASEYTAFRQRWVTGMDIPHDPETNQPLEPFRAAVDRLFMEENPDAKFGEFSESDLGNFVKAIELVVQHVASQTRTPPHYFYLSGQFPSGDAIKSAETGLVAKARRKMRHLGEAWEEVMGLAFQVLDPSDPRGGITDSETIWADPESRSEAEHIDAVIKRRALGVPLQQLWEDCGYSPSQIARFAAMLAEEATWALPSTETGAKAAINA